MRIKETLRVALHAPAVKAVIEVIPGLRTIYSPWQRSHPFDKFYGIDASGFLPAKKIHADPKLAAAIIGYAGSQAGVVRGALSALGDTRDYVFIDVGCGKGRAAIVASEFPFREIIGIELSAELANIARGNVFKISERFPDRPPITIHTCNALDFAPPPRKSVIYMYHSLGRELMKRFAAKFGIRAGCSGCTGDILGLLQSGFWRGSGCITCVEPLVRRCHSLRSLRNWLWTG